MFLISKGYAKLWHLDPKEKFMDVRFSTSEKDNREGHEGEYINSNWMGRLYGKANEKAKELGLEGKERIVIHSAKITNIYSKEKEKSFVNVYIFDFDVQENQGSSRVDDDHPVVEEDEEDDDKLPF